MRRRIIALGLTACSVIAPALRADRFELKDGGEVSGEVLERNEEGNYLVRTGEGAEISLARPSIQRIVQQGSDAAEYQTRSRAMQDTPAAHRELAEWCRSKKMLADADHHLARAAELDPNDEDSRRSLGFQRVGNRWLTADQLMTERGMVFFDGKYRTKQDIAVRERNKNQDSVNVDWFLELKKWRGFLDNRREDRVREGEAQIMAISDPQAAPAIIRLMKDEPDDAVFEMLLRVLAQLDHPAALQQLVAYTLDPETDAEVRAQCRDYLLRWPRPVPIVPYVEALKSKDNKVVNLAGVALGHLNDPAALSPLIDAVVTTHKVVEGSPEAPGSAQRFSASAGGGLSMGGDAPKVYHIDFNNERVLQALHKLSGNQKFEYDEPAWRAWYVDMQMRQHVNARRDQ
jgi:hypothetical protein